MKGPNFIRIQGHTFSLFVLVIRLISFNSQPHRQQHDERNSSLQLPHRHHQSNPEISNLYRSKRKNSSKIGSLPAKEGNFLSESGPLRSKLEMGLRFIERRVGLLRKDWISTRVNVGLEARERE